jgi:hypothetical protein
MNKWYYLIVVLLFFCGQGFCPPRQFKQPMRGAAGLPWLACLIVPVRFKAATARLSSVSFFFFL